MKINDEELKSLMGKTNIEIDSQWQTTSLENIKKSVTDSNNFGTNNSNLNFISNIMMKRKIVIMGVIFLSLLSVFAVVGLAVTNLRITQNVLNDKDILAKISMANPGLNQSRSAYSSATGANAISELSQDAKLIAPGYLPESDYNYYYSKSSTKRGPAFDSCNYGVDQSSIVYVPTYESFNYNDNSTYYSKYVGYNEDGSINTLSISKSLTTDSTYEYEDITYFGGDYAIKTVNKTQIDDSLTRPLEDTAEPMLLESSPAESVNNDASTSVVTDYPNYFGDSASVKRTETINGKDYYIIEYSYEVNCDGFVSLDRWESNSVEDKKTLYTVTYASVDSYQILKTETYFNSVEPANLMDTTESMNENVNIDFSSVASNFEFTSNVPIREIDTSSQSATVSTYDPDTEVQKSLAFAKSEDLTLVLPLVSATNQYIYLNHTSPEDYIATTNGYYPDRSFYPAGEIGDKMYNSYNGITSALSIGTVPLSLGSISYTINDSSYNLSIYANSVEEKKVLNSFLYTDLQNKNEEIVNITIGGELVEATLYSFEVDQPEYSTLPYIDSMSETTVAPPADACTQDCLVKQYILVFNYDNNKYALQEYTYISGNTQTEFNTTIDGMFEALSASSATDLVEIETLLNNSIKGTYVDGSTGGEVTPVP